MIICLLFTGLSMPLMSQTVNVKSEVTRQPLKVVSISSKQPEVSLTTDGNGQADISGMKGADSITFRLLGYRSAVRSYSEIKANDFTVYLQRSDISLDNVTISATRWEQKQKDVPNKIATITSEEVTLQNPQTAADLLGTSGEVYIQKSQLGGGSPMMRGFATQRVLLVVDGVRMNTAIFRGGNLQNVISLDPFSIEMTEALFGPSSVMYGSDAIGGVMSFQTLPAELSETDEPRIDGNAVARYSSANSEQTGHFDINIGLDKWAWRTSISHSDYGDQHMGSFGPDAYLRPQYAKRIDSQDVAVRNDQPEVQKPSGFTMTYLMQKIRYQPSESWDLSYGFHYSTTSDIPRYDRLYRRNNGRPGNAEWYYGPQKWMQNNLTIEHKQSNPLYNNARLTVAQQFFEESRHDRDFGDPNMRHRVEQIDVYTANLDLERSFGDKHTLFYGAEGVVNQVGSEAWEENINTGVEQDVGTRYPDGSNWNSYAGYLNYRFAISNQVTLRAGARYNQVTAQAEFDTSFYPLPFTSAELNTGAFTGSLGLVYRSVTDWEIYGNLSTGFRAPNIDDIGKVFDSEPGSVIVPNPDLGPEYAYNAEVGIAKMFNQVVKVDVTGFYTLLENALVRRDFSLNGRDSIVYDGTLSQVQALKNASQARVWGVQGGIEVKLPNGIGLSSRINVQEGEELRDEGKNVPLRHAAPTFGETHLTYSRERMKLDLYSRYNGEIAYDDLSPSEKGKPHLYAPDGNGNHHSPAWYTLNFKALYQLTDVFMLTAGVENITDQRYRTYSSGIAAPGRNFILSVKASF
jgi:hemoglobin/transferrin/lactoferrin receptor protein